MTEYERVLAELTGLKAHIADMHKAIRKRGLYLGAGKKGELPDDKKYQEGTMVKKLWRLAGVKP